jgi:glycerol-3-phosphate dehydrogenase (NAD(P)+)
MSDDHDMIAIVGAGAWGTALANALARPVRRVILWGRNASLIAQMGQLRENTPYLPGIRLAAGIEPTSRLDDIGNASLLVLAVPAQATADACKEIHGIIKPGAPLVITAKGILRESGRFPSEVAAECLPDNPIAILSGPSFAEDVARGLPTAVVLAASQAEMAACLAEHLSGPVLRCYHSTDPRGVEIGGAAKNVLAIAAGIVAGRGLGESARAALTARGFAELMRLARRAGGRPETLMGLSGLGDLVLTCGSARSRNFACGVNLGRGLAPTDASGGRLVEGAFTADILAAKASALGIDMPIVQAVADVLAGKLGIDAAVVGLMARPVKAEM